MARDGDGLCPRVASGRTSTPSECRSAEPPLSPARVLNTEPQLLRPPAPPVPAPSSPRGSGPSPPTTGQHRTWDGQQQARPLPAGRKLMRDSTLRGHPRASARSSRHEMGSWSPTAGHPDELRRDLEVPPASASGSPGGPDAGDHLSRPVATYPNRDRARRRMTLGIRDDLVNIGRALRGRAGDDGRQPGLRPAPMGRGSPAGGASV